ncbi:polysaccharide biosynthesis protein [Porphyromonas crevioricanis]|uniref:Polysaccharide biosynthesis protein n=2 Tax=Porphyromonas crevioricanis TaxID=393921 RepID=A0A0A2FVP7_9PORP|nr:lipopolysaccharide biosynthesis protein [Porphyromonas crevioricanis]KGN89968.1 polysaccharide biosynthesis protein [Porphyromonas crevioricanis]KGN94150.1 polysaccharide biosynthesis protein [Porphyromonas crevioricanis]SJZ67428.1 Membrane protein involved in the export of O-antigen and teichoic acid [Porphyromonas crevioricanis]SQH73963.1 Polysaccharide biosynthesis protein [Porphyromonas crevioricanis]GAD04648.1 polysaccharide biosynthesis protein [Porphyromonas crevioricanis JCM 15906]
MATIRSLVKDTAVYGLSSIAGRFLNWMLVPMYTRVLSTTAEYGIVTNLYAWTALLLIILTYGMETAFFRYMNKDDDPRSVYSTTLWSLGSTSSLFVLVGLLFIGPISTALGYPDRWDCVAMLIVIVAMDAFMAIPFAYLRYANRPWRFAALKFTFIGLNIGLNLFFLLLCPWLLRVAPSLLDWWYEPSYQVGYIFVSNLIASGIVLLLSLPYCRTGFAFRKDLLRRMLGYAFPILLLGIAGNFNKVADKILFPLILTNRAEADAQLGIYGACFKIAVVMVMCTQAFRYAYEPFIFNKKKGEDERERKAYAEVMKYYIIFTLFVFLGVTAYMDLLKNFVAQSYHGGLAVVPWVMIGEIFFGIYFNISTWYKVTDRTYWGAIFSLLGCLITVLIIVWGVPRYGFMACAWASVVSNGTMMLASYAVGRHYYRVPYQLGNAGLYALLSIAFFSAMQGIEYVFSYRPVWAMLLNTIFLLLFLLVFVYRDLDPSLLPSRLSRSLPRFNNRKR